MKNYFQDRKCQQLVAQDKEGISRIAAGFLGKLKGSKTTYKLLCNAEAHSFIGGKWYCQSCLADLMMAESKEDLGNEPSKEVDLPVYRFVEPETPSYQPYQGVSICTGYVNGRKVSSSKVTEE